MLIQFYDKLNDMFSLIIKLVLYFVFLCVILFYVIAFIYLSLAFCECHHFLVDVCSHLRFTCTQRDHKVCLWFSPIIQWMKYSCWCHHCGYSTFILELCITQLYPWTSLQGKNVRSFQYKLELHIVFSDIAFNYIICNAKFY